MSKKPTYKELEQRIQLLEEAAIEARRVQDALDESEEKFRAFVDSIPAGVMLYQDDRWIFANRAAEIITGYSARELLQMNFWDIVHPDYKALVQERGWKHQRGEETINHYELKIIAKDGTERWVGLTGALTTIRGRPAGVVSLADITERKRTEEALTASEEKFRITALTTTDAIWDWNITEGKLEWFGDIDTILGYDTREFPRTLEAWEKAIHPDDRDRVMTALERHLHIQTPYDEEYCIVQKNGNLRYWTDRGVALHDKKGNAFRMIGACTDITERKRAEEALKASEEKFRSLFDNAVEGICQTTPEGRIVNANRAFAIMHGYGSPEEVVNSVTDITEQMYANPDDRKKFIGLLMEKGYIDNFECPRRRKDGTIFWVAISGRLTCFQDGTPCFEGLVVDITKRKRAEEALKESEEKFRLLFEKSVDPILISHEDRFIDCNDAAVKLVQCSSREDLIGLNPANISPERQPDGRLSSEKVREINEKTFRDGTSHFEWVHRTTGGEDFWVDVSLTAIPIQGKQMFFTVWRDIRERKKAEEALRKAHDDLELRVQERTAQLTVAYGSLQREMEQRERVEERLRHSQKMEAIGTLAGGIAHDFNNILAAVIGFAEMVEEDLPPDSKSILRIQRILKAAYRGRDLVKQILAFSRKTDLMRTPLSLSPLLEETVHLLRASLPTTIDIKLSMEAASDTILASPTELQQITMNLATNASFAMREKGGILGIGVTNVDFEPDFPVLDEDIEPGEYVQLAITDTGHGIEPHVMKRIFEPFFTTKGVGEGTGMGLAVVYGIVKSLNGSILVESKPGMGSTFRVFLPVAPTDEKSEASERQLIPKGSEHILFVDDEELLMEWGQAILERLGYTVTALADSTEALKIFSSDPSRFDLVIADQTMPKLAGLSLARKLLALRPNIPVILCTGHSDSVSPEKAKEAGIKEFLMKPLGRQGLAEAIRKTLNMTGPEG